MKARKIICILMSICLVVCTLPFAFADDGDTYVNTHGWDEELKTECGGDCDYTPVIIVPGIMQSQTYVQDADGNDILTTDGFPIYEGMDLSFMFDTIAVKQDIKDRLPDMLAAIAKSDRDGLLDVAMEIFNNCFSDHYFNPDGTEINHRYTDTYWYSLEECQNTPDRSYGYVKGYSTDENGNTLPTTKYKTQYDFIKRQVNISEYCEMAGYDHAYYYAYPSFGNVFDAAESLNEYIDMVKCQTGHDKVNIVFISLGGTIANVYLSQYIDKSEVERVVLAACALDGSYLLGDLMDAATTFDDGNVLYNELIPNIVSIAADEYMALAYAGNVVARAIPQEVFSDFVQEAFERAVNEVLGKLLRNCQSMWALVPSEVYPELSEKYISDTDHEKLKEITDKYYEIQKNAKSRLRELDSDGVDIFVISGYNLQLPAAVEHYNISSDNIIQAESTSLGATFADYGTSFADNYKPALDPSYIDPDRLVDAGSCALPDKTFFIKNQSHLTLQSSVNDVIGLCVDLITDRSITDAREHSGGYPQFNEYRDLSTIESLMNKYESAENKTDACNKAYADAEKLLASKVWSQEETDNVEQEFYKAMEGADNLSSSADSSFVKYELKPFLTKICKMVSDFFKRIFAGNDFWLFFIPLI